MSTKATEDKSKTQYKYMIDLLAVYSEACNRLAMLETDSTQEFLMWVDESKEEYAELQEAIGKAEAALENLALANPDWFEGKKSIRTLYGTVKLTKSTKMEVANEEVTLVLLEARAKTDELFKLEDVTRSVRTLNLEALEKLDDTTLAGFRIKRVTTENFKVEPLKVDMGKAVKESTAKAAA